MLPRIFVLATGGTIAGITHTTDTTSYRSGILNIGDLLTTVPSLKFFAHVEAEQIANIDSKDLTFRLWEILVSRIQSLCADDTIDGIVITHGTDTLEETAYALHLILNEHKPIVLTAAMRPATAISPDGPINLLNAVIVAANPASRGQGVLVSFNNRIHSARDITKVSTYAIDAFESPEFGALGYVQGGYVEFARNMTRVRPTENDTRLVMTNKWPVVDIITSYVGVSRIAIDALIKVGVGGIVVAGTGNGSIHITLQYVLANAAKQGIAVVRTSRTGSGHVMRNGAVNDDALHFISAGSLNPYKARILLMFGLANGITGSIALQKLFDKY
ncbi:MAG: asparaginase [Burkholderia sp.]|nr:asparaginase [Burkholderia sp.]